ncbi:MAG: carotenoid oxygenase family protein, partial [Cyanobacteriota bacterium]|nr:carotenoid oxygenase family protein [Cyanobacteriota bacterium]
MSQSVLQPQTPNTSTQTEQQEPPGFPKAILSVSREEFYGQDDAHQPLKLSIKKGLTNEVGHLPSELHGSVFIVAPAGNAASQSVNPVQNDAREAGEQVVLPSKDGWTSLLNGDGMVYRLDFEPDPNTHNCEAYLSNRLIKTPSYFADKITNDPNGNYGKFSFYNLGLARVSFYVGVSDQVNTAFLPIPFPGDSNTRLLATWDVGRPYEIDPDSLQVIAPVGLNEEWEQIVENLPAFPFPQRISSAHPCFDPEKGEVFTTNVVKSLETLLQLAALIDHNCTQWFLNLLPRKIRSFFRVFVQVLVGLIDAFFDFLKCFGLGQTDETYLIRWNGSGSLQKWKIAYGGRPVKIKATMHQMGLSKDYIVLTDTAFKIVIESFIPAIQKKLFRKFEKSNYSLSSEDIYRQVVDWTLLIREFLTFPQSPDTDFYIVPRAQLDQVPSGGSIEAEKFTIQGECNHYLVDYDNPDDKITIHAALNKASDAAEFIHKNDVSTFPDRNPSEFAGIFSNGMAVNRPAIYVVDGKSGSKQKEQVLNFEQSKTYTWSIGLYAYRDDLPTRQFEDIYWLGFGAWSDIQTQFIYDLYQDYIHRDPQMPLDELMNVIQEQGVPTILSRLHIDRDSEPMLQIVDSYEIPAQYFANSPQFIPKKGSTGSTDGYIVCSAVYSDNFLSDREPDPNWSNNSELWVFDASNLNQGPLCRLSHPR